MADALGMIECRSFAATVEAADAMMCTATTSPTRVAAFWPASQAAFTAATSPRTMAVV